VSTNKLSKVVLIGIITSVTAAGSFALSLVVPGSQVNHQLAIKTPENTSLKNPKHQEIGNLGKVMSTSAQAVVPSKNVISDVPKLFQGTIISQAKLKPTDKVVALTFDDGPGPKNTVQVLEILKKNNVKATFFMVGEMVQAFPKIAKQVADDGHVIGNHTWHHWYRRMDTATAAKEIDRTADIIYKTTGEKTSLFRPPGGFLNNGLVAYAKNHHYAVMMWSGESGDAERRSPQVPGLVKNVIKSSKPGAIILMHDGGGNRAKTVKALPQMIADLKAQGYRFVTIPELLQIQDKEQMATAPSPTVTPAVTDEYPNPQPNN
jgi:peptidoglycan-N-acetylglucosamine deacetylase